MLIDTGVSEEQFDAESVSFDRSVGLHGTIGHIAGISPDALSQDSCRPIVA